MRLNAERILTIASAVAAGGVLVTAPRFASAFQMVERGIDLGVVHIPTHIITGPAFGVLYSASIFVGLQATTMKMRQPPTSRGRWWWIPGAAALLQVLSGTVILVPMFAADLAGVPLSRFLTEQFGSASLLVWSTVVAVAADLVPLTAAAVAGTLLPRAETSIQVARHEQTEEQASKPSRSASKYVCSVCGWVADGADDKQKARRLAGHMSSHARKGKNGRTDQG